ncbi:MAG TPA: inositol monophosphatase family protein [Phycisphaerales bacterium]|nr:inositol monophosphatase family protein [Phycisphaerales bacterium]
MARLEAARAAARAADQIARRWFAAPALAVRDKADGSPVTGADLEIESALRRALLGAFPDDAFLGEEHGASAGASGYRWIVDPIDGTQSFVRRVPLFGTLIGLEHAGRCVAGVIAMPALGETVWAGEGLGCWHETGAGEATPARVSGARDPRTALLCVTSLDSFARAGRRGLHDRLQRAVGVTRGWSDCYGAVLLATGRIDALAEPLVHPWDVAALYPIIREAGGVASDLRGEERIDSGTLLGASSPELHRALLRVVAADAAESSRGPE